MKKEEKKKSGLDPELWITVCFLGSLAILLIHNLMAYGAYCPMW